MVKEQMEGWTSHEHTHTHTQRHLHSLSIKRAFYCQITIRLCIDDKKQQQQ